MAFLKGFFLFSLILIGIIGPTRTGWSQPGPEGPLAREELADYAKEPLPDEGVLRQWIAAMKESARGPFKRIRWFCNDGTVHPPRPYACSERGGGVQHGEWTNRVKRLRAHGYFVANVLADLDPERFTTSADWEDHLRQILLEQFMIDADDGWILRQARFYRGALQAENEAAKGLGILKSLLKNQGWGERNFLLLREAVRFLPHGRHMAPLTEMRQFATTIADKDPRFAKYRVKLHVRPDPGDAGAVRRYAAVSRKPELAEAYERLAALIEEVYQPRRIDAELRATADLVKSAKLAHLLRKYATGLAADQPFAVRYATAGRALATIRDHHAGGGTPTRMLYLLHLSLDLEQEVYALANQWLDHLAQSSRRERLDYLKATASSLYGMGLLSGWQRQALEESFERLAATTIPAAAYKGELDYLGRVPEWAEGHLHFHFSETIDKLMRIEPRFALYITDRLRGSPLTPMAAVLDSLTAEANRLVGLRHEIFGEPAAGGIVALNPGLARGPLRFFRSDEAISTMDRDAIYVLPETLAELPPIAGIISAGHGNALSHLQLLARNLGIPNVVLAKRVLDRLAGHEGRPLVLAVSPAGVVQLAADGPQWDEVFRRDRAMADFLIRPDLNRLDLSQRNPVVLQHLGADDSGRIVGPKAANLGELKRLYPDLVAEGLALPFGSFRRHLEQPIEPGGPSAFRWMQERYAAIRQIENPQARASATADFLQRLREWILSRDFGEEFRRELWGALFHAFGRDGSYGVFVRSDTNVEDLPGFTGAGLNLTLPNVAGFENILQAIRRVWASPFTERAYGWRQSHMEQPEHVYVSVLLMKSVPADKSGVMVTADVHTGDREWLSLAVNEGIGGAVEGQRAEELLIHRTSGRVRLLAQATEPEKRVLLPAGGVSTVRASGADSLLSREDIETLMRMAESLPRRFPELVDSSGQAAPADIEFGFADGRFYLFQIRPFLESSTAQRNQYLRTLDTRRRENGTLMVNLNEIPREGGS